MPIQIELVDENDETLLVNPMIPLRMNQVKKKKRVRKLQRMCLMTDSRR
jgi:hypothetical protein